MAFAPSEFAGLGVRRPGLPARIATLTSCMTAVAFLVRGPADTAQVA
jgi:hypothetical protein